MNSTWYRAMSTAHVMVWVVLLAACNSDDKAENEPGERSSVREAREARESRAIRLPAKVRDNRPDSYKAALRQGNKLLDEHKYVEAVRAFRVGLEFKPDDARALSEISWAAFKAGDLHAARRAAEASIRRATDNKLKAASLYNLGRVEQREGNIDAARRAYTESLVLRPNKTVRKRLKSMNRNRAK